MVPIPGWYMSSIPIPWYHGMETPYHIPLFPIPCHPIPYHWNDRGIPHSRASHTIIPKLSLGVWGPFYKYENYFCRLQYFSIELHLLWMGSSGFCWHFMLQVEVIQWTPSFINQFNWALFQGLLGIIHYKLFKIIYLALAMQLAQYSSQINQYCIHCNNMAFEKQTK